MFIFHIYPHGSTYFYKGLLNLFSFIFIRQVMLGGRYFTTSLFSRNPFKSRSAHKDNKIQNKSWTRKNTKFSNSNMR